MPAGSGLDYVGERIKEKEVEEKQQPEQPKETTPEFVASIASVLVIGLFIITFCMQAFEIPTSSMVAPC